MALVNSWLMKAGSWVCVLGLCLSMAGLASGTEVGQPAISMGFNDSHPLAYVDENGAPQGILVSISRTLLSRADITATYGVYPAPRLFRLLQEGNLQISMLVRAPALAECCMFSQAPVMTHVLRVYSIGDKPPVRSREELTGKSVIILHGYSYAGMANFLLDEKNRVKVESAKGIEAAFQMLKSGRADYLLAYDANTDDYLGSNSIPGLKSEIIARFPVHIVLAKSYPNAQKTMDRLESLLKVASRSGTAR